MESCTKRKNKFKSRQKIKSIDFGKIGQMVKLIQLFLQYAPQVESRFRASNVQLNAKKLVTGNEAKTSEHETSFGSQRVAVASGVDTHGAAAIGFGSPSQIECAALAHLAHEEIAADALVHDRIGYPV